jgi:hypothetical protein
MYNSSNSNSNNTRGVKRILRTVNPPTAKRMMTKRFKNKINNQVVKEAAKYGITNLNATRLDLSNKGLAKIPDFVFYMKNLNYLFLTENNLTSLPAEIGQLKKLTILNIGDNKLTSLPATIGQLTNLNVLYLYENELTSLPATIGQLKNLEELELTHNNLTSLPATIGQLKKLSTLTSAHNELTSLPATIGQMKNLKKLNVSFNRISSLPTTIGRLRNLERFDLGHNELTSLPESFKNLSDSVVIRVDYGKKYTKQQFMKQFKPKRINKNTELFNAGVYLTNNIPRGKRAYISTPSDVKNNGTLRRVYNKNGLNEALRIRGGRARLHGNNFSANNVRLINNKNFNLQRIRVRLLNTPLNNMRATIEGVKNNLPPNVSRTDVNNVVRNLKPLVLNKIRNRLRTTPANQRQALLNKFKRGGLINNLDVL